MKILTPDLYFQSIVDVKIELLKERKIKGLIIDIDNTLVGWDVDLPTEEIIRWLENIKHQGFKICLVSNNNRKRVELFAKDLNLPYIFNARKPMRKNLRKAMKILETSTEETCIVGDQNFYRYTWRKSYWSYNNTIKAYKKQRVLVDSLC